jgi:hypothetical protein
MTPSASRDIRSKAFEIKFIVDRDRGDRVREAGRQVLSPDPWATGPLSDEYRTTTVYFDTDEFDVYRRRGSFRRAKYRIRRYGRDDIVFLERKLRTDDVLSKRRTSLNIGELDRLHRGIDSAWPGLWFQQRILMRRLAPRCQVSYTRTARTGMTEYGPIRLTLDDGLAVGVAEIARFDDRQCIDLLSDKTIVEMKFTAMMPAVFKRIVEDFSLEPVRVSKFRLGIEATHTVVSSDDSRSRSDALEGPTP